jgi:hypothetical protein
MIEGLFLPIFGLAALYFTLWLFILLPARMAKMRGRSAFGWVLVSILFPPFLASLLLWLLSGNPNRQIH